MDLVVSNTAERSRAQAGTIDHDIGLTARVVRVGRVGDMGQTSPFEDAAVFHALGNQPWQVNCRVDTDRREPLSVIDARGELVGRQVAELVQT